MEEKTNTQPQERQIINVVQVPEAKKEKFQTAKKIAVKVLAGIGIFIASVYTYFALTPAR